MAEIQQIVCPHCLTPNRVPNGRLNDHPNCGKCRQPLFAGTPMEVDEAGFRKLIAQNGPPVIVDFWASWCGPCQAMAPHFAAAAAQLEPRFRLAKVNTEEAQTASAQYGIRSIPTLIAFHQGKEINRISGALTQQQLVQWVQSLGVRS